MVLRFWVPCSRTTAPSTGLPFSSTTRPLTTLVAAVGEVPPIVHGEKLVTPTSFTKCAAGVVVSTVVLLKFGKSCCCQPVLGLVTYLYSRRLTAAPGPGLVSTLPFKSPTR